LSSGRLATRGLGRKNWSRRLPTWFSTWPFSHPDAGEQATGSTRWCEHICAEALVILARLADKNRLYRRLHVVVDAAPADPAIKRERLVMGVKHQLLRLPKIDPHERHPAVRKLHVRRLDHQRQPLERDRLMAPVELIGLARRKAHRHISARRRPGPFAAPCFEIGLWRTGARCHASHHSRNPATS